MQTTRHQARKPTRTVAPTVAPLSLAQVKRHLNLSQDDATHDELLADLIEVARDQWEDDTDYAVMSSTYTQTYDDFPLSPVPLLRRPVAAITHVKYYDESAVLQTWSSANYWLDAGGAHPALVYDADAIIPTVDDDRPEAVVITYTAGSSAATGVPPTVRQALLLLIAHYFEHRGVVHQGQFSETPRAYKSFVDSWRRSTYP